MQITSAVLDMLIPGLANKSMHRLSLDGVQFEVMRQGVDFAVDMIQRSRMMNHFCWAYNGTVDVADSSRLFNAVLHHPFLEDITLDAYTPIGENGYDNLVSLLTTKSNMTRLSYRSNNVRTEGDTRLSDFITTNPPLDYHSLVLEDNELEDDDAIMIAGALQHNTNLHGLNLLNNPFTEVGFAALERAVCDQSSLNSLSDCNHTCALSISEQRKFNTCSNRRLNRPSKLYQLMSARNMKGINVDCLKKEMDDDDILNLVPNILECIHRYHSCCGCDIMQRHQVVFPLSIMFEVSRKMPELYER